MHPKKHRHFFGVPGPFLWPERLESKILGRTVCVMHSQHPLAARARLHVRDLQGQVLLTLAQGDTFQAQFQQLLRVHHVKPAASVETTYSFTICRMAAQGAGIGIVNPYAASVFARDVSVVPLSPALTGGNCPALPASVRAIPNHRDFQSVVPGRTQEGTQRLSPPKVPEPSTSAWQSNGLHALVGADRTSRVPEHLCPNPPEPVRRAGSARDSCHGPRP